MPAATLFAVSVSDLAYRQLRFLDRGLSRGPRQADDRGHRIPFGAL